MISDSASREKAWSRRKFWIVFGSVFAVQIVLLFFFGRPDAVTVVETVPKTSFRMLVGTVKPGALDSLLVSDPALFVLPSRSSFSGAAWMNIKEMDYSPAEWTEPPRWLTLRPDRLTATFNQFVQINRSPLLPVSEKNVPSEPAPKFASVANRKSRLKMDGAIMERFADALPELNSWQNAEPLDHSIVQVGVNEAGQVVSARLNNRSGSAAADKAALKIAETLRFSPATGASLVWGNLHFIWQTEVLPTTNAPTAVTESR